MTKTEPVAHDPSKPSSFASRRAEREAREAEHGPPPATRRLAFAAGDDAESATRVVISRVQS